MTLVHIRRVRVARRQRAADGSFHSIRPEEVVAPRARRVVARGPIANYVRGFGPGHATRGLAKPSGVPRHAIDPDPPPGRRRGGDPGDHGPRPGDRGQGRRHARRPHGGRLLGRVVTRRLQGRLGTSRPIRRSRSGTRPRGRRSRRSRGTPTSSSRWPSTRRASASSRGARTSRAPGSWEMPGSLAPSKTLTNPAGVPALALRPDGKQAVAASGKALTIWDLDAGKPARTIDKLPADVESVAWRADGGQVAAGDKGGTIRLFNPADGSPQGTVDQPADTVLGIAYLPNGQGPTSRPDRTAWRGSGRCRSSRRRRSTPRGTSSRPRATARGSPRRTARNSSRSATRRRARSSAR